MRVNLSLRLAYRHSCLRLARNLRLDPRSEVLCAPRVSARCSKKKLNKECGDFYLYFLQENFSVYLCVYFLSLAETDASTLVSSPTFFSSSFFLSRDSLPLCACRRGLLRR